MNKHIPLLFSLVFFLTACRGGVLTPTTIPPRAISTPVPTSTSIPTFTPVVLPTVTAVCVPADPAQSDVDRALSYTGAAFADWEQSYTIQPLRVSVTWQNSAQSALAYLEAVIFPCGYEEPDLNAYFSDANWQSIFSNYESYKSIGYCRTADGLRLYQFKAQSSGADYLINYWTQNDTNNRVITLMLVFPAGALPQLGDYSARLFPRLPNCS